MTSNPCRPFADLLLDYADGELSGQKRAAVANHLARCAACRGQVERLQRSLDFAQAAWRQAAAAAPREVFPAAMAPAKGASQGQRARWLRPLVTAASLALAAAAAWALVQRFDGPPFTVPYQPSLSQKADDTPAPNVGNSSTAQDLEQLIQQRAQSARLAISLQILAEAPDVQPYHQQAQRYLARAYGESGFDHNTPGEALNQ